MGAKSSKGIKICISKASPAGSPAGTVLDDITAITKANPPEVASVKGGALAAGTVVSFPNGSTGLESLDGKSFVVTNPKAGTFDLLGVDATGDTGTFAAPGAGKEPTAYEAADMECLCLSSIGFNPESAETIAVGTFCDPSATIPGATTGAGTLSFGGYVDINDTDYQELLAAEMDGKERIWRIMMPNNGYIIFPATVGAFNWVLGLEGAVGYEGTAVLGSKPRHLF